MGRRPRVEYSGAIYHVIQRGNNREYIFEKDEDKLFLLSELERRQRLSGFILYGYVLMGNHYHMVLQIGETPLSKIMHLLNSNYGRYYNRSRKRTGHIFDGRYKAIPIQNEQYLLAVLRYVHRNPVRVGICKSVQNYQWSSDSQYRNNLDGLVDISLLLNMLSDNRDEAIKKYLAFLAGEDEVKYDEIDTLGDQPFNLMVRPPREIPARRNLDEILRDETGVCSTDFELIKIGSRKRHLIQHKVTYITKAIKHGYTLQEIGNNIGISAVAVSKLINRSLAPEN